MKKLSKREGIMFMIILIWIICLFIEIFIFQIFPKEFGITINGLPLAILIMIIIPREFSKKYNNWLESDLIKNKNKNENKNRLCK